MKNTKQSADLNLTMLGVFGVAVIAAWSTVLAKIASFMPAMAQSFQAGMIL